MKIGILQTGVAPDELVEDLGDFNDMFYVLLAGQDFTMKTWRVLDMEFPDSVHEADGWLITGSKFGAYEDHAFIPPLEDFIRQSVTEKVPMVGICFGHQIIAQALGGKVEKFEKGWVVGRQTYDFGGTEIALNAWHQDQVVERPEGAHVLASNDMCENAALIYGDRALTFQAHPEFESDMIEGLANTRGKGVVPEPLLKQAMDQIAEPNANRMIADQIADFFRAERG